MEEQLKLSTKAGSDKFKNKTKKQMAKIAQENSFLEKSSEIPPEYIKVNNITSKMRFIKGALRLAKVQIFGKLRNVLKPV